MCHAHSAAKAAAVGRLSQLTADGNEIALAFLTLLRLYGRGLPCQDAIYHLGQQSERMRDGAPLPLTPEGN